MNQSIASSWYRNMEFVQSLNEMLNYESENERNSHSSILPRSKPLLYSSLTSTEEEIFTNSEQASCPSITLSNNNIIPVTNTQDTQQSIFSARWLESEEEKEGKICFLPCEETMPTTLNDDNLPIIDCYLEDSVWDEKWSLEVDLTFENETYSIFNQIQNNLVYDEKLDFDCCRVKWTKLASMSNNLENAPALIRLKRRLLHHPSQDTTQTVAAPISALEWSKRFKKQKTMKNSYLFGGEILGEDYHPAKHIGVKCREKNLEIFKEEITPPPESFVCGWMSPLEQETAFKAIVRVINKSIHNNISFHLLENIKSSIDILCRVQSREQILGILELLNLQQKMVHSFHNDSFPLLSRAIGLWRELARFVIVDIKFVLLNNPDDSLIQAFFSKPRIQVEGIIQSILMGKRKKIGLGEFLYAAKLLCKHEPIMSWDKLFYSLNNYKM